MLKTFITSTLDEQGLSPSEFRVFCHLSRRAGNGVCFASIKVISEHCNLNHKTVRSSIHNLQRLRMIRIDTTPGKPNRITISKEEDWIMPKKTDPYQKSIGDPSQNLVGDPSQNDTGEVYPTKGTQLRNPLTPPPRAKAKAEKADKMKLLNEWVELIYEAYPRKKARPKAFKAILNALKRGVSAEELLAKTKAYALTRKHEDPQFTPHPATWFNQERYNDEDDAPNPEQLKKTDRNFGIREFTSKDDRMRIIQRRELGIESLGQHLASRNGHPPQGGVNGESR